MVQKMDRDLPDFVGREKQGQAARTERLLKWTGEACPRGEDWTGRFFLLPQAWEIKG